MTKAIYLDSSAIVKLVVREAESLALRREIEGRRQLLSSALARVEVPRALMASGAKTVQRGRKVLDTLELVRISGRVLERAAELRPESLRPLDALHVATALLLEDDLGALITYDGRMRAAAESLGCPIAAPS